MNAYTANTLETMPDDATPPAADAALADAAAADDAQAQAREDAPIRLRYVEGSRRLQALLDADVDMESLSPDVLHATVQAAGHDNCRLHDNAHALLVERAGAGNYGAVDIGQGPAHTSLKFEFNASSGILHAVLEASERPQEVTADALQAWLKAKGFDAYHRESHALDDLLARFGAGKTGKVAFATRLDARIRVELAKDHMQAWVTTMQAYGGAPLDHARVESALQKAGIATRFYNSKTIQQLVEGAPVSRQLIAEGKPAEHGSNARFEFLVEESISRGRDEDAHGNMKLREHNTFVIVEPGTPVLRKIPATPGTDGHTVTGTLLAATPGRELNFSSSLSGVDIDPNNPNQLIAIIRGHPVHFRTAVKVDPVLRLDDVDIKSGDIEFDGSVNIAGDVQAGMVVKASGNVQVNGIVEKASLIVGNDLTVAGGIIGGDTTRDSRKENQQEDDPEDEDADDAGQHGSRSHIKTGGSISAKYVSHAELECGQDLVVAEYLMHSNAIVQGRLLLGQDGGKGCLIGGHSHADKGAAIKVLGNENYLRTHLSIGYCEEFVAQLQEAEEAVNRQKASLMKLQGLCKQYEDANEARGPSKERNGMIVKLRNTMQVVGNELEDLEKQLQDLLASQQQDEIPQASVTSRAYPNVRLRINGARLRLETETGNGSYVLENNTLKFAGS